MMMGNDIRRIVIWQNVVSIHQSAFVRALAVRPRTEVWFGYERDLPNFRKNMGWTVPDFAPARLVDVRDPVEWNRLSAMDDAGACHVFGSYFHLPKAYSAFRRVSDSPCRRVWTTEAFNFQGWQGWIRLQRARWLVRREARAGFHRIFAMGNLGIECFRRAGIEADCLHEFGYVVEPPGAQPCDKKMLSDNPGHRFLFVGQLIRRKGVDLLLDALARLPQKGWSLSLIGDGRERKALMALSHAKGLSPQVRFLGNQPNAAVLSAIQAADALVLPSRWDGWGAVVNEALMVGTPVIVSDACGSASLVVNERCGQVFRRRDTTDLGRVLGLSYQRGSTTEPARGELREWARHACGAEQLAAYFLGCMEGLEQRAPQQPPWRVGSPN